MTSVDFDYYDPLYVSQGSLVKLLIAQDALMADHLYTSTQGNLAVAILPSTNQLTQLAS